MFLNLEQRDKSAIAVIDDSRTQLSYGELCEFCDIFKEYVPQRTLLFILSENSIGSLLGYVASLSNRIVPLLLNCRTDEELLNNLFDRYSPAYLWLPEEMAANYPYQTLFGSHHYVLLQTNRKAPELYDDLSLLLPTSGSTGSSKLVRHSYRNIEANARNVSQLFELTAEERAMAMLPMHYTMGLSVIASHLLVGATLLLTKKSLTEKDFWTLLKEERATSFTGVPYSFEVLEKLRFFRMDLPSLKLITQGGGKMSETLFHTCAEYATRTGKKFIATYGQTEGTARMAYLPAEWAMSKTCSIGHAVPNGKLMIVDENGKEIDGCEATGEMVYEGENVTLGYAYAPEDLSKGDENRGILHTGDLVRRDADGCYYVIGRMGRFLKIFGYRVGLDECEQLIKTAFAIDCACTGNDECMSVFITDATYSEQVVNLLVTKLHLIASAFKIRTIDRIPKSDAGKTLYTQLK